MEPKSITNGANLAQGGGQGVPENQRKYKIIKKQKVGNKMRTKRLGGIVGRISQNRRVQRLGVYRGIINRCGKNGI